MKQQVIPVFSSVKTVQRLVDVNKLGGSVNVTNLLDLIRQELPLSIDDMDELEGITGDVNFIIADNSESAKKILTLLDTIGINTASPITVEDTMDKNAVFYGEDEITLDNVEDLFKSIHEHAQGSNYFRSLDILSRLKDALDHEELFSDLTPEIITAEGLYLDALAPEGYTNFAVYYAACDPDILREGGTPHDILTEEHEEAIDYDTLFTMIRIGISKKDEEHKVGVSIDEDGSFFTVFNPAAASMIEGLRPGLLSIITMEPDDPDAVLARTWIINHNGFDPVPPGKAQEFFADTTVNDVLFGDNTVFMEVDDMEAQRYPFIRQVFDSDIAASIAEALMGSSDEDDTYDE